MRQRERERSLADPPGSEELILVAEMARSIEYLDSESLLSDLTEGPRPELSAFGPYIEREFSLNHLRDIRREHCESFLNRPRFGPAGIKAPAENSRHSSLSAIRLGFRAARAVGLVPGDFDPTLDIEFPRRPDRLARPLTDAEIAIGRSYALTTFAETRVATAFALAEATARPSEQAWIRVSDVDLEKRCVFILGRKLTRPRTGPLTEWGAIQVERRLRALSRLRVDDPLLLFRKEDSPATSRNGIAGSLIRRALSLAGIWGQPGVGSNSIVAWAGAHALEMGATIDEVARMLGVRKLDTAAVIIGWDWRRIGSSVT